MNHRRFALLGPLLAGASLFCVISTVAAAANADSQEISGISSADTTTGTFGADRLGDRFSTFAGSEDNATALANALLNGTGVTLTTTVNGQATTLTFTPAVTGPLNYQDTNTALALAEEQLEKLGISQPTPTEIEAALNGGSVTTGSGASATSTQLSGVLTLHQQGQSWTQVAQSIGTSLDAALNESNDSMDATDTAEVGGGQSEAGRITDRLADRFTTFAGSEDNATALVNGLRNGTAISLTTTVNGQTTTTTITPPTGNMGYGNVWHALSLAQQDLAMAGITQPTPAEIEAALNGGSVTTGSGSTAVTTQLQGVLALRSQNLGWGQIAQTLGVTVNTAEAENLDAAHEATETAETESTAEDATETSEASEASQNTAETAEDADMDSSAHAAMTAANAVSSSMHAADAAAHTADDAAQSAAAATAAAHSAADAAHAADTAQSAVTAAHTAEDAARSAADAARAAAAAAHAAAAAEQASHVDIPVLPPEIPHDFGGGHG